MRRLLVVTALVTASAALAGCERDDRDAVSSSSTSTVTSTSAVTSTSTSTTTPRPQCTRSGAEAPAENEAIHRDQPTDFDGDGTRDPIHSPDASGLWFYPSSARASHVDVPTAKPYSMLLALDIGGDGLQEAFVRYNRAEESLVRVLALRDCEVGYVLNRDGAPYEFVVRGTDARGDSVGCVDVDGDGKLELVGLHYERNGDEVRWERTVVQLHNGRAENGSVDTGVFRSPRDDDKIEVLRSVSCGDKVDTGA